MTVPRYRQSEGATENAPLWRDLSDNTTYLDDSLEMRGSFGASVDGSVDSLYQSPFNWKRDIKDALNVTEGVHFVKLTKSAGANPTAGHFASGAAVDVTGGSLDHFATFYAYFQGLGTNFNTGFGFQAHMWSGTAGQGLIGLAGHMELNNASSNSGTALYGADLYTAILQGTAAGATGIGLNVGVRGAGWAAGSYNAILGRGTVSGENWGTSFRGFSSRTGNNGVAKMDVTVIDLGAGGAAAFFDCTDVRLLVGEIHKLADQSLSSFIIQDSAGGSIFTVSSTGKTSHPASSTSRATVNIPHGSAPSAPVNGDIWTTTAGIFVRVNGATVGPLT